jgi:hypothetical protein
MIEAKARHVAVAIHPGRCRPDHVIQARIVERTELASGVIATVDAQRQPVGPL